MSCKLNISSILMKGMTYVTDYADIMRFFYFAENMQIK